MYIHDTKDKLWYSCVTECCTEMKKYKYLLKPDVNPTVTIPNETEKDR